MAVRGTYQHDAFGSCVYRTTRAKFARGMKSHTNRARNRSAHRAMSVASPKDRDYAIYHAPGYKTGEAKTRLVKKQN